MSSYKNLCRFNAASVGSGAFVVASHVTGCKTPAEASAKDATTYRYHAQSVDGSVWEDGEGVYTVSSVTLTRVTISDNSDGTLLPILFTSLPEVDVFPSPPPALEQIVFIPSGTLMLFQQSAAPVGWTKQTTHNDKALRVVSGSAASGGSNSFSSVMAQTTVGAHALTIAEMPSHTHPPATGDGFFEHNTSSPLNEFAKIVANPDSSGETIRASITGAAGSSNTHTHSIALSVQYVDLIIASKDAFPT